MQLRTSLSLYRPLMPRFPQDRALQDAITEIRTLLERFANGKSMGIIVDAFNALADDAKRDQELRDWFRAVDGYVRKVCTLFLSSSIPPNIILFSRFFWSLVMFWSRTATHRRIIFASRAVNFTMTSIRTTSIIYSRVLGSGSRQWVMTQYVPLSAFFHRVY